MIPRWLPDHGSVVLTGATGCYQSYLGFDAACAVAADGGHVVVLYEHPGASANLPAQIVEWRNARNVQIGTRMRMAGLVARHLSSADLRRHVKQAFDGRAVDLILRDFSLSTANHDFDAWLREAGILASENGCTVLTVLADRPNVQNDLSLADTVWRSAPFRDPIKQHSMNARLVREQPLPALSLAYAGRQSGGHVLFTEMEPAHA